MKYLFEDKADDYLSRLFRYSLPEKLHCLLEYSDGNGNLVKKSEELLKAGETVVVILDTIPANKAIRDIYISLRRLSRQYGYRLIVWNILCAEYYFISCFGKDRSLRVFESDRDFDMVANVKPYKESILIQTEEDRAFSKTFEKFCKLYIMKNGGECVYPKNIFFEDDCECGPECARKSLIAKSDEYRNAYGFPLETEKNEEVLWNVHRKLLQITNKAIEVYNTAGYLNIKTYPEIKSMDKQTSTSKPIDSFGN